MVSRALKGTGALLTGVAGLVLIGRFAGIKRLVTLMDGGAVMAFPTALGLLICGAGFLAVAYERRRAGMVAGGVAIALGLGALVLYASAETLGWQRFVFDPKHPVLAMGVGFDGRMSPNAAASFAVLGACLLIMARGSWWPRRLTVLAAVLMAVAVMALVGYATGLRASFSWWRYTAMAVHTAASFLVAAMAVLTWVIRRTPVEERTVVRTFPFFAIAATMLLVLSVVVRVSNEEREDAMRTVRRTLEVKSGIERFIGAMARRDTATQSYALTGDDYYLGRMKVHLTAVRTAMDDLAQLTADNAAQTARVVALRSWAERNFALKDEQARLRREQGIEAAVAVFRAEPKEIMAGLRAATDGLTAEEDRLLAEREAASKFNAQRLNVALTVGGGVALALLGAAFSLVSRAKERLREAHDRLEERVAERTRELERASAAVRETEQRFRDALVSSPVPAMLWADDGRVLLANRVWRELSGYAEEELRTLGDWTQRALGRPPPEKLREYLDQRFVTVARVHDGERSIRTRSGETRVWDFHTASIGRLPDGARLLVTKAMDVTAGREAETRLRESEMNYRFLADMLPQMVWTATAEGQADTFNRGWLDYTGLTLAESCESGWLRIVHTEDAAACGEEWRAMLRAGRAGGGEYRLRRAADGEYRWHLWRAHPQRDDRQRIERWVGTSTDIHEQKLLAKELDLRVAARTRELTVAQAHLAASNRLQRGVLDGTPFSIIATRPDGMIDVFNRGAEQMLGYAAGEMVGRQTPQILHRSDEVIARAEKLSQQLGRRIEPGFDVFVAPARLGRLDEREWTYVRKDGSELTVLLSVTALHDEAGTITGFLGIAQDLTQRRAAEASLRESEERVRLFAEHAPASVAMFDREMRYLVASRRWFADYGVEGRTIIGRSHYEVFPEIGEEWKAIHRRCLAGQVETREADLFVRADGSRQWLRWEVRPWHDRTGAIGGIVMFTADITERKRLEENLAVARDQALEASRMKSEFLANMSHEIRTPMNAVLGMGSLLADTPLSPDQQDMVRTLQGGAESLLAIINDILDFSKIEAGKLRLELADFDLHRLLEETVALLAPHAHAKNLELTCEVDTSVRLALFGDGGRLRQVVTNLLGNAIKFTERGEIDVTVRAVPAGPRLKVRVSVRDTGVGIAHDAQTRLFQPFTQEDASTTRRFGGTGLGLAISRQLVELMGGQIGFESEPGHGSLFWFEVELARQLAPAEPTVSTLPAGRRVLVVDDNETNRRITLSQLARAGLAGEAVADGAAALARLRGPESWDAVLLDWHMPGMSGLDLAIEIRADATLAALPMIMLSSAGPAADVGTATAVGFAGLLTKPVSDGQLHRCLARVLAERLPARPAVPASGQSAGGEARRLRILLVEDNPANQRVASLLLAKLGHEVDLAGNGQLALEQLSRKNYDVVLMDCQMPVLDGYEATRRIRSEKLPGVNARVPIIALTAYAMPSDRSKSIAAGMDDHLTKPIRVADLRGAFERCGVLRAVAPAAPATESPAVPPDGIFDADVFATVRALPGMKGPSLLPELFHMYLADESERLARMARLTAERAEDDLAHEAHGFGGNVASFGAVKARAAALELERAARAGDWETAETWLEVLRAACAELREAIRRLNLPHP